MSSPGRAVRDRLQSLVLVERRLVAVRMRGEAKVTFLTMPVKVPSLDPHDGLADMPARVFGRLSYHTVMVASEIWR
jgi:hypothetical protein